LEAFPIRGLFRLRPRDRSPPSSKPFAHRWLMALLLQPPNWITRLGEFPGSPKEGHASPLFPPFIGSIRLLWQVASESLPNGCGAPCFRAEDSPQPSHGLRLGSIRQFVFLFPSSGAVLQFLSPCFSVSPRTRELPSSVLWPMLVLGPLLDRPCSSGL